MKKIVCFLLALMLLLSVVSCSKPSLPDNTNTLPNQNDPEESENTDVGLLLPEADFGGRKFVMLCRSARVDQFDQDGTSGMKLDNAVFRRNSKVEEDYKIEIECIPVTDNGSGGKGSEFNARLDASQMSGCYEYDVVAPDYYWGCEIKGQLTNLLDLPYLNFDASWWWNGWNECFTINHTLTSAVGWLTLDIVQGMEVCYFNKQIMSSIGYSDPYDLVYDKEWTLEQMMEMSTQATVGINADGSREPNYVYGTILHYMGLWSLMFGSGVKFATYQDDGSVQLNLATATNDKIANKLSKWINNGDNSVFYCGFGDIGHNLSVNELPTETASMFAGGHALFYCYGIKTAELLASMNMTYGILPPPLMDEKQENYISTTFGTSYFAIERGHTQDQKEFAAFILEALNYYSYTMVKDVYYEDILKLMYVSDMETRDMIDFVVNNVYIDFAHITNNYTGKLRDEMLNCILTGKSIYTRWAEIETPVEQKLADYLEGYQK